MSHPYDMQPKPTQTEPTKVAVPAPTYGAQTDPAAKPAPKANEMLGNPAIQKTPAYEDLLLNNTPKFVETIKQEVRQELTDAENRKRTMEKFYDELYEENPDLKDYSDHVQSTLTGKLNEWSEKPLNEAKNLLAQESRKLIDRVKQNLGVKTEEVKGDRATTLPASGEQPSQSPKPAPQKVSNFFEEAQALKRKRQKLA